MLPLTNHHTSRQDEIELAAAWEALSQLHGHPLDEAERMEITRNVGGLFALLNQWDIEAQEAKKESSDAIQKEEPPQA